MSANATVLKTKIDLYRQRHEALKSARSSWLTTWREIAQHQRPRAFRENVTDAATGGEKKHHHIVNSVPLDSVRTLGSGMMAGITSPSRPWFRLTTRDNKLAELPAVKTYLAEVEVILRDAMAKSNVYKGLHSVYLDLGPFGVSTLYIEEDQEDGFRAYNFPIGSYCLATGPRGNVTAIFREITMTVAQLVKMFGLAKCSKQVQGMHRNGSLEHPVPVTHVIEPNEDRQPVLGAKSMAWASCWYESGASGNDNMLREEGFEEFPVMAPRWEVTGEDTYGHGPGWQAQGDCKALQLLEKRSAQAVDKIVNPPMVAPADLRNTPMSLLPGDVTFTPNAAAAGSVRPAVDINFQVVTVFREKIDAHEHRIKKAYFADLWLMLSESEGTMTAREVIERREEKLLQLGTVLEALQDELLDPLIDRVFNILLRQGRLPDPPQELQGMDLKIEYISIMAQAQKLLGTTGIERLVTFVGGIAATRPEVLDKLDLDQIVDEYATMLGVPPATVRADEVVEALRQVRAKQMEKQAALEQAQQGATAAKTLAETPMEGPNALNTMLQSMGAR